MPICDCRSAVLFSSEPSADDEYQSLISSFFSVHTFGLKWKTNLVITVNHDVFAMGVVKTKHFKCV